MNQIQIDILQLVGRQRLFQRTDHVLLLVKIIPQFRSDENILPFHRSVLDFGPESPANFRLVTVEPSAVDVPVSNVYGVFYSFFHLVGI